MARVGFVFDLTNKNQLGGHFWPGFSNRDQESREQFSLDGQELKSNLPDDHARPEEMVEMVLKDVLPCTALVNPSTTRCGSRRKSPIRPFTRVSLVTKFTGALSTQECYHAAC